MLLFSIVLIVKGVYSMHKSFGEAFGEAFGEYRNLADCIQKNLDKRDPEQYCRKIREKVETARRQKYGQADCEPYNIDTWEIVYPE